MSLDTDDEILQDFLIEAGEILELLSEQLVDLESKPQDSDLLNAIFRGFHTVKGGAGFLSLTNLVNVCHVSENIFDLLRQGKRHVDAELMDVFLKALDSVNDMFAEIRNGQMPSPAEQSLLDQLEKFTKETGETNETAEEVVEEPVAAPTPEPTREPAPQASQPENNTDKKDDEISEEEFEALLDALQGKTEEPEVKPTPKPESSDEEDITEEEFEALLDELQAGKKVAEPTPDPVPKPEIKSEVKPEPKDKPKPQSPPPPAKNTKQSQKETGITPEATVRVDTSRLDEIMNMVGELVLVRNRLVKLRGDSTDNSMVKAVSNLDIVTADLQMAVMKTRMQPIKKVFGRFPRVVRDLARSLKKEVVLEMEGEETDLDKNLVEALSDPLVHLVRNSVDHGIEAPDDRVQAGKERIGKILLSAEQAGDHILLSITDDGKGMDPEALRQSAIEKGVMDQDAAARLDERECYNLIFMPGFSTKQEISDISGRGVGMDVVKTKISQLNGTIEIDSKKGKGSQISIKVPLTLAILPTLMVAVGDQIFALPLTSVNEIFNLDLSKTNIVDGQLVIIVRDKAIPLFYLNKWLMRDFTSHPTNSDNGHVVIVSVGTQRVGFVVDGLLGQEEVVIKALGDMLQGTAGMAGATITGDGKIAMILDVPSLLNQYA